MRYSGLTQSEVIEIRGAINRFISARGWMRRNFEKATKEEQTRYQEIEDAFDKTWAKYKKQMSEEDIDKFNKMLASDTVAPQDKSHQYEFEQRPDNIDEEPELYQKPEDFEPNKKPIEVKQINKPKLKKNQPELF